MSLPRFRPLLLDLVHSFIPLTGDVFACVPVGVSEDGFQCLSDQPGAVARPTELHGGISVEAQHVYTQHLDRQFVD